MKRMMMAVLLAVAGIVAADSDVDALKAVHENTDPETKVHIGNCYVEGVMAWLRKVADGLKHEDLVLNVAGPRESKCPGIQESTRTFVTRLIERLKQEMRKTMKS